MKNITEIDELAPSAPVAAKEAGLRYVSDEKAGITRKARGKEWRYLDAKGKPVNDPETLRRIRSLAIPPAWTNVWICPHENGHIQATGRDARGRKQYRYHPRWREVRDTAKYERMLSFGERLPHIRKRVEQDLQQRGMSRDKVLATVVRLLETTLIRVGNDEYAQQNRSYGLTTLRNKHAKVRGAQVSFEFLGKSGKRHKIDVRDPTLARLVRRCQELPGQELFGYVDESGEVRDVTSNDVNQYLREIAGEEYSAKDFRTWAGTVLAAIALREFEQFASQKQAKRNVVTAIEAVAKMLGNTPAICRKCYVHPIVLESYLAGQTIATLEQAANRKLRQTLASLKPEEAAVMTMLRERLRLAEKAGGSHQVAELAEAEAPSKRKKRAPRA